MNKPYLGKVDSRSSKHTGEVFNVAPIVDNDL